MNSSSVSGCGHLLKAQSIVLHGGLEEVADPKNMLVSYFYESLGVTESKSLRRWKVQHMCQSVLYHEQPEKRSDYDDYDFAFHLSVFLVFCQTQHTITMIITDCSVEVKQTYR